MSNNLVFAFECSSWDSSCLFNFLSNRFNVCAWRTWNKVGSKSQLCQGSDQSTNLLSTRTEPWWIVACCLQTRLHYLALFAVNPLGRVTFCNAELILVTTRPEYSHHTHCTTVWFGGTSSDDWRTLPLSSDAWAPQVDELSAFLSNVSRKLNNSHFMCVSLQKSKLKPCCVHGGLLMQRAWIVIGTGVGVEEALQTNETVDIFQEECLVSSDLLDSITAECVVYRCWRPVSFKGRWLLRGLHTWVRRKLVPLLRHTPSWRRGTALRPPVLEIKVEATIDLRSDQRNRSTRTSTMWPTPKVNELPRVPEKVLFV